MTLRIPFVFPAVGESQAAWCLCRQVCPTGGRTQIAADSTVRSQSHPRDLSSEIVGIILKICLYAVHLAIKIYIKF